MINIYYLGNLYFNFC